MSPETKKNILAVICGFLVGCVVNLTLVNVGPHVIALPEGASVETMEELKESMKLFKPANFLFPFLGHALGTLVGALVAAKLAAGHKMRVAMIVGGFFLLGGIAMVAMVGGPTWFCVTDLVAAYLPMAAIGGLLGGGRKSDIPVVSPTAP